MSQDEDREKVLAFFRSHPLMTISTVSRDGDPQAAAVYVHMSERNLCYCVTRNTTRKFINILNNPRVSLLAYNETTMQSGEIAGYARLVEDTALAATLLPALQQTATNRTFLCWMPPVGQVEGHGYVFFEIIPETMTYYDYGVCEGVDPKPVVIELNPRHA